MKKLATWMADVMDTVTPEGEFDAAVSAKVKSEVLALCKEFPVYDYVD